MILYHHVIRGGAGIATIRDVAQRAKDKKLLVFRKCI